MGGTSAAKATSDVKLRSDEQLNVVMLLRAVFYVKSFSLYESPL